MRRGPAYTAIALLIMVSAIAVAAQESPAIDAGCQGVAELNLMSQGLIDKAASGSASANAFRIEARLYRELLRKLALDNRRLPEAKRIPEDLLFEMVRLSALLHSAAECKTGRVITCPADLMIQLRAQQAVVSKALESMSSLSP